MKIEMRLETMAELKPCPFCGEIPSIGYLSPYYQLNGNCSVCGSLRFVTLDEYKLIIKWNRWVEKCLNVQRI